jgi:hypothetical protein
LELKRDKPGWAGRDDTAVKLTGRVFRLKREGFHKV